MANTGYDLGNVTFGLGADTSSLQRSLDMLKQFGDRTNQVARSTEEGAKKIEAAFARQERAVMGVYTSIQNLNSQIKSVGAPIDLLRQSSAQMKEFTSTMTRGALSATEFGRAASIVRERIADIQRQLQKGVVSNTNQDKMAAAIFGAKGSYEKTQAQVTRVGAPVDMAPLSRAYQELQTAVKQSGGRIHEIHAAQRAYNTELAKTTGELRDWQYQMKQIDQLQRQVNSVANRQVRYGMTTNFPTSAAGMINQARGMANAKDFTGAATVLGDLRGKIAAAEQQIAAAATRTEKWSNVMRGFERATILAMGPLSGLGARAAVMASLFETMTVRSALFVAGTAALTTGIAMTAAAAVKATMEMQKWEAMLTAASGAQMLVGGEMDYLYKQADRFGMAMQTIVPSYANFATSARLAGMSLKEQRDIFESVSMAGTALKWSNDQVGRAFLALEQMMSKGTIQMQEVKLQMGQVLPGAFEIFAMAAGKSQREFAKMMEQGQVASRDILPKVAKVIKDIYEAASQLGMVSIQAELGRFQTGQFKLAESFDKVTKASVLFQGAMKGVNSAMAFVSDNMRTLLALITAFSVSALVALLRVPAVFNLLTTAVKGTAAAMLMLNTAASGNVFVRAIQAILSIGAGVTAYKLLKGAVSETAEATQAHINEVAMSIAQIQKLGSVSQRVYDEMKKDIIDNIMALKVQDQAYRETINVAAGEQKKNPVKSKLKDVFSFLPGVEGPSDQIEQAYEGLFANSQSMAAYKKQLEALLNVKVTPDVSQKVTGDATKGFASASNSLRKFIDDLKDAQLAEKLSNLGDIDAKMYVEASNKAKDFVTSHGKVAGELYGKYKKELESLGIKGNDLTSVLTQLFMATSKQQEASERAAAALKAQEEAASSLASTYSDLTQLSNQMFEAVIDAAADNNPIEKFKRSIDKSVLEMKDKGADIVAKNFALPLDTPGYQEKMLAMWDQINKEAERYGEYLREYRAPDLVSAYEDDLGKLYSSLQNFSSILESEVTVGTKSAGAAKAELRKQTLELATAYSARLNPMLNELAYEMRDMPELYSRVIAMQSKLNATIAEASKDKWYDGMVKGAQSYADAIEDSFSRAKDFTEKSFKDMEDAMVEFVMTGKMSISDLAESVYRDLVRMTIQTNITGNFAKAIQNTNWSGVFGDMGNSFFGGIFGGGGSSPSAPVLLQVANGGVIGSQGFMPLQKFASGGIANKPQLAMFAEGSTPEAFVPVPSGKIPVELNVKGGAQAPMINIYVQGVRDEGSLRKSAGQVAQAAASALQQSRRYN